MSLGIITAHYGVEGEGFYGFPLAEYLPYSVSRTWHVQIGLFLIATAWLAAGLFIWPLVSNHEPKYQRLGVNILFGALLLAVATAAIALFYGAGLTWGQHSHQTMVEYWRWWVVHLWVEGFFEVFATTVIAFVFMRLNLVRPGLAAAAALLSATIFLAGGIIGTCHHLYFSGTPTVALAWGSVFSALEVVPLTLIGFDAVEDLRRSQASPWVQRYKWPIYFFVSVAFWNMIGAGLFGFMINPPIALYYMQGLNTTPLHAHAALFGVYGMLGIGLMLMCLLSLLPVGLLQTKASVESGYWFARSSEFMQTDLMQTLRSMRVPGDTIFFLGAVALVWFILGLKTGHSFSNVDDGFDPPDSDDSASLNPDARKEQRDTALL